jgi:hypothetical protein
MILSSAFVEIEYVGFCKCAYQSECGDQPPHLGHWVEVH